MWRIELDKMHAFPPILDKPANMLTLEIRNIKSNSPEGQHLVERCVTAHSIEWDILDACRGAKTLMASEATKC